MATAPANSQPPPTEVQEAVLVASPQPPPAPAPPVPHEHAELAVSTYQADYSGASTLELDSVATEELASPFPNEAYDIKPTGEVFVSQVHYRRRLNKVFGPGQWALIPRAVFRRDGSVLMREYELRARNHYISEAVGECEYQESNDRMTWADAAEGVKSNALTRACKDLGIASECWDRIWANRWRDGHCIQVWIDGRNKPQWRRLDAPPFYREQQPTDEWLWAHPNHVDSNGRQPAGAEDERVSTSVGEVQPGSGQHAAVAGAEPNPSYVGPRRPAAPPPSSGGRRQPVQACQKCNSMKDVIWSKKTQGALYCFPCQHEWTPATKQ